MCDVGSARVRKCDGATEAHLLGLSSRARVRVCHSNWDHQIGFRRSRTKLITSKQRPSEAVREPTRDGKSNQNKAKQRAPNEQKGVPLMCLYRTIHCNRQPETSSRRTKHKADFSVALCVRALLALSLVEVSSEVAGETCANLPTTEAHCLV